MKTYTAEQFAEECGMTAEDVMEIYGEGVDLFYVIEDHPVAGCRRRTPDGDKFDIFGCGYDKNDVGYKNMVKYITEID